MFSLLYRPFDVVKVGFMHDEFHYRASARGSVKRCTFIRKNTRDFECYCDMYYQWSNHALWVDKRSMVGGNFDISMWASTFDIQEAANARTQRIKTLPQWIRHLFGDL